MLCFSLIPASAQPEKQLRVFIRAGAKTHGPGQHDHPRFLADWKKLLKTGECEAIIRRAVVKDVEVMNHQMIPLLKLTSLNVPQHDGTDADQFSQLFD